MAPPLTFASTTRIAAPPEVVWPIMSDHVRYAAWGSAKRVTMDRVGSPDPNGVGAVRCFHAGPAKVREEVLEFEPPRRMVYRVASGLPVVDYRSEMVLEVDGAGSVLRWSSSFRPRVPRTGALLRTVMARAVARFAAGIADAAAAAAGSGSGADR